MRGVLKRTAVSSVGITAMTGCLGLDSDSGGSQPDSGHSHDGGGHSHSNGPDDKGDKQSFDPPNAVYKPQHMDEMSMVGMSNVEGITFGTMHAAPHPFPTTAG